jgi:hypothetical protein
MRLLSINLVFLLAAVGCGGRDIPLVTIHGKLTFGGSPPPQPGKIIFSPVENPNSGLIARPGNADFDANGSFVVTTFSPGDGLIPGKYRTTVHCYREPPTLDNYQAVSFVPLDYNPEVTIPADVGSFEVNLNVPATRVNSAAR